MTNASTNGTAEVEAAITDASGGTTALVVDNPSQISGSVTAGLSFNSTPIYDSAGDQPDAITEADLTGNGQLDLIVANGAHRYDLGDPQSHELQPHGDKLHGRRKCHGRCRG